MFNFFFKRPPKTGTSSSTAPAAQESPYQPERQPAAEEKAAWLADAEALDSEAAAVEFISRAGFAEARLKAAGHIHSRESLEKVLQAVRNSDRRVARLMQQRLEILARKERNELEARTLVEKAQALVGQERLVPSQLTEIDLAWKKLVDVAEPLAGLFAASRGILQGRMDEQLALQRALIDVRDRLRNLNNAFNNPFSNTPALPGSIPDLEQSEDTIAQLEQKVQAFVQSAETPSLPKNLLDDVALTLRAAKHDLEQLRRRSHAMKAHDEAYAGWESQAAEPQPAESLDGNAVRRAVAGLPELAEEDRPAYEQRLKSLLDRISVTEQAADKARSEGGREGKASNRSGGKKSEAVAGQENEKKDIALPDGNVLVEALARLEQALEDGALQIAVEQEWLLKLADTRPEGESGSSQWPFPWTKAHSSRLAKARAELVRLQGWARWGGQVSREELIKTAEALPGQEILPLELAKKVGSLRAVWKSMDTTSGPAGKELWLRFDAACKAAYAPATEHFRLLAEERKRNLEQASVLILELESFASGFDAGDLDSVDWRKLSTYRGQALQAWRALGPIDRKEKKVADARFSEAIRTLSEPLAARQKIEAQRREELIAEAEKLDPADRHSMDAMRQLQQRWQEHAKALPLERKEEQVLWQKFRARCDQYFEQRKAVKQQSESQQDANLRLKEAICERLEAAAELPEEAVASVLRESDSEWNEIGPVPRAAERTVQRRHGDAVSALKGRIDLARRAARSEQFQRIGAKLALCCAAEELAAAVSPSAEAQAQRVQGEWQAVAPLQKPGRELKEWEGKLQRRFEVAIQAVAETSTRPGESDSEGYAQVLRDGRAALERNLLLLEILLEAESPAELAGQRLKLQIEILQSSLKSGMSFDPTQIFSSIIETPAANDEYSIARTRRLLSYMAQRDA